jgi:radical SAM superfamily enzyme YgiQ (UPF0313 family)
MVYYDMVIDGLTKRIFKIRLYNWNEEDTAQKVKEAVNFLKYSRQKKFDLKSYHHFATIFFSFESIFNSFMSEMASRHLVGLSVPHRVEIFFENLVNLVLHYGPDMIGISVLFNSQTVFAMLIASLIREKKDMKHIKIVFGGARFGIMRSPEILFKETWVFSTKEKFRHVEFGQYVDYLIPGEGEKALLNLCMAKDEKDLSEVPNLVYIKDKKVRVNKPYVIHDLDHLPVPDFSDFCLDKYISPATVLPFLSSRGCPWRRCTFCTHHRSYSFYRELEIKECLKQIMYLKKRYGVAFFNFYDEMIPPSRFRDLAKALINEGIEIYYAAYAKPVKEFDSDLLRQIYQSGGRLVMWGVESASQRVLNLMRKGTNIKDIEKVIRKATRAGLVNLIFIMFGFPTETEIEFAKTLHFLEKNKDYIHTLSKGKFVLSEGSFIYRKPEKFAITEIREAKGSRVYNRIFDYEVSKGLGPKDISVLYEKNIKSLESIGFTPRFGVYRDHLLVYSASKGSKGNLKDHNLT